ncbi:hypothetical protein [Demequina sp. NBRC 110051]|uniref:hypothetical protein n=1 Tax=Demequina sp. NBRC 110051 TaxID=1570340 RepID=UPI0009FDB683|nr:hypothetical protein [Demequina sp. NBRC 110051]
MRRHLTATLAVTTALLCSACAGSATDEAAPLTAPGAADIAPSTDPAGIYWDTVSGIETEVEEIISVAIGQSFHDRVGGQDTSVALATVAATDLAWQLDGGFDEIPERSRDEDILVAAEADPASIGDTSADATRAKAFLRFGSEDSRDHARDFCRIVAEGTRAEFIAAVADAADASRTDVASPAASGAELAPVVCPELTDEYLEALRELGSLG